MGVLRCVNAILHGPAATGGGFWNVFQSDILELQVPEDIGSLVFLWTHD